MFEDMTIGVDARVGDAVSGLTLVSERLDEVGDEADDAADETSRLTTRLSLLGPVSASASGGLGTLAATSAGLVVTFGTLAAAGTAALTPLLAIGGAGGALAALAATGAVGHMAALNHELSTAKTEIREILGPLGDEFAPFLLTAVRRSDDLVEEIVASIGPLGEFKDTLRLIGAVGEEQIPKVTGALFQLARENQDELRGLIAFLGNNAPGAIRALGDAAEEVGPETADLGMALADLAPTALETAVVIGEELIPAVTGLVNAADGALEAFNEMPDELQTVTVWAMTLAGAIGVLSTAIGGLGGLSAGGLLGGGLATGGGGVAIGTALGTAIGVGIVQQLQQAGVIDTVRNAGERTGETFGEVSTAATVSNIGTNPLTRQVVRGGSGILGLASGEGFFSGVSRADQMFSRADARVERELAERRASDTQSVYGPADPGRVQNLIFDNVVIEANSREEGRAAARGLKNELGSEMRAQNVEGTSSGRSP